MNVKNYLRKLPTLLMNDFDDTRFVSLKMMTKGMTSARIAKMIYYAAKDLEPGEVYCEQGTWTGFTLAAAGLDGTELVIGIDPYDLEFSTKEVGEKARERMKENLEFFNIQALVLNEDFRNVKWDRLETIGALFIDADHTYQDVIDGLAWAQPHLSNEAIIILDDIRAERVEEAMYDWLSNHKNYILEALIRGGLPKDQYSHNGLAILSYKKV